MESPHYAAFLSYSHEDEKWARWVHRRLERYRVPRRLREAGLTPTTQHRTRPIFRDREELPSAGNLGGKVLEAIAQSRALIVICSPAAARSRWVNEEILGFKRIHGDEPILCLVVDGEPNAGDERECFAPALRFKLDSDGNLGNQPAEPIAADARPGKDGRSLALLKIIAGLLGIGLDDLRQREQQRRNRRVTGVALASLAGMALTGFLAIDAMIARDDAQRRQQQAEDLVDFMLGDLKAELGKVGRLDALDATAQKVVDYFESLPEKELDDDALARRAAAFRAIGEIHMDRHEWDLALAINQLALDDARQLLARDPDNTERLFDLSQSQFWVGYAHMEADQLGAAEGALQAYLELSERLLTTDPDNPEWIMEVSYGHTNLAALYRELGRPAAAVESAEKGVNFNRRAAIQAPDDPWYREELAGALVWLANAQLSDARLTSAARNRTEAREFYESMLASDPDNMQRREQLATSLRGEANTLHLLGQHDVAAERMATALGHFTMLTRFDGSNERWATWAQGAALDMVLIHLDGQLAGVRNWNMTSLYLEQLVGESFPDDAVLESLRLLCTMVTPLMSASRNALWSCDECPSVAEALTSLEQLAEEHAGNLDVIFSLAVARQQLAIASVADETLAVRIDRSTLETSAQRLESLLADQQDPRYVGALARLHFLLGNRDEAARLVGDLDAAGYGVAAFRSECRAVSLCESQL